jgi:superfamily II DNA/RNA helicase
LSFTDLGLNSECITALENAGYKEPTELQTQLIPLVNDKKNVLVKNHSASGKTGAFLIPAINYILNNPIEDYTGTRILVLTSRKDRVNQIKYTIKRIGEQNFRFGFIVSGRPYQPQMRLLRRPLDMMIATPGRLNDLAENGKADFSNLEMLIIDDLSSVYHKEFQGLVDRILAEKANDYPVIVFVRDEEDVIRYAKSIIPDAVELEVDEDKSPLAQIPQAIYQTDDYTHKIALMDYMLDEYQGERLLVFTTNPKSAKTLSENMANHGHSIDVASELTPEELASSDAIIVSDQDNVDIDNWDFKHVVHFEMPKNADHYKKRLEDKSWEDRENEVICLLGFQERELVQKIEGEIGSSLPIKTMGGLAPLNSFPMLAPAKQQAKKTGNGKPQKKQAGNKQFGRRNQHAGKQHNGKQQNGKRHSQEQSQSERKGRKGAYGRLSGGIHRKRDENTQDNTNNHKSKQNHNGSKANGYKDKKFQKRSDNNTARKPEVRRKSKGKMGRFVPSIMSDGKSQADFPVLKERGEAEIDESKVVVRYKEKKWGGFNK